MNKTVTINLSGIVFHIDENAYDTLKKYIESIRSKFTVADGRDEIVSDIEARIAEMFQQRVSDSKQAILPDDVNDVINTLGKPEDISNASETPSATETVAGDKVTVKKRFFRNPDDKFLAGVCGGISAYFDIDPIWLRLVFAIAFFFGGTGFLLYIILWIIIPMAKTPSDKIQMRGDDVTLSAIQKSVQKELEGVKTKAGEMVNEVRSKDISHKLTNFVKEVVMALVKFISNVLSIVAIAFSLIILFVLTVMLLCVFGLFGFAMQNHLLLMVAPRIHMFFGLIGLLLMLGVPAVLLFLAGLKWLFKINWNLKRVAAILAGITLIGVGICLITAYNISKYYSSYAAVYTTTAWQVPANKVLHIKLNPKHLKVNSVNLGNGSFSIDTDNDEDSVLHTSVELRVEQGTADSVELVTAYTSRGLNRAEAYSLAKQIDYDFSNTDSTLLINSYCTIGKGDVFRAQKVKLILRLPVNTSIKLEKNLDSDHLGLDIQTTNDMDDDDLYGHTFTMTADGLKCNDCADTTSNDDSERRIHRHVTHHIHDKMKHETDSLKLKVGHKQGTNSGMKFADYLDENNHSDDAIMFPAEVAKAAVVSYSNTFISYIDNTMHPDEVISYVGDMYETGKSYASAFNDYLNGVVNPDDSINVPDNNSRMADNMNRDFINYLATTLSANEAINYPVANTEQLVSQPKEVKTVNTEVSSVNYNQTANAVKSLH